MVEQWKAACIDKERYPWYSIGSKIEAFALLMPFMILDVLIIPQWWTGDGFSTHSVKINILPPEK